MSEPAIDMPASSRGHGGEQRREMRRWGCGAANMLRHLQQRRGWRMDNLKEEFGREVANVEDSFDWLAEESKFGGVKAIQAVRVVARALLLFGG